MQIEPNRPIVIKYSEVKWPEDFPYKLLKRSPISVDINKLYFHNGMEIGLCYKGSGLFSVYNNIVPFSEGDISIIFPDQPHVAINSPVDTSYWYFLNVDVNILFADMAVTEYQPVADMLSKTHAMPNIIKSGSHPDIEETVKLIFKEFENRQPEYKNIVKALIWVFLLKITRLANSSSDEFASLYDSGNDFTLISPSICFILSQYKKDFTLDELANSCYLSKRHYTRIFQKVMRQTPFEYLAQIRIRMSTALLKSTDLPITDIALDIGYRSISSFNRQFKVIMQTTPREYRNKYR